MADLSSFVSTINNIIKGINENVVNPIQSGVSEVFGTPEPDSEISYIPEDTPVSEQPKQEYFVNQVKSTDLEQPDISISEDNRDKEKKSNPLHIDNLVSRLALDTDKPDLVEQETPISAIPFGDESAIKKIYSPAEVIRNLRNQNNRELNPNITAFESAAKQYRDDNAQRMLQDELKERGDFQRQFGEDVINQSFGQMGFDYSQDPLYQQQVENTRTGEYDPSGVSNEFLRRIMDENGKAKSNPLDWNIMGLSSQSITSPGARAVYESYFDKNPGDNRAVNRGVVSPTLIDDGHSEASREGLYMTGEQYLNYRNAGIPGRDVYDIDPNEIYSKQDEMESFGFIPYITSESSKNRFSELADANELNNAFTHLANARRENTDFGVNYDGRQYSGAELQRAVGPFARKLAEQANQSNAVFNRDEASEFAIPHIPQYHVKDEKTGNVQNFDGEPIIKQEQPDGKIYYEWADGQWARFTNRDDLLSSMSKNYRPAKDNEENNATMWLNVDPLTLADGTQLRADKAQELFQQLNNEDAHDYGPLGWGRQDVEGIQDGFLPWITDMALGSAPLFWWPTSISQAGGQTLSSSTGMRPGSDNFINGTYSMLADRPTEEQRAAATVGSAAMPFTERLYGNLGSNMLTKLSPKPIRTFFSNIDDKTPATRYLAGTVGEGLEEIPGNLVEELMQGHGPSEFFANDLTDEEGNVVRNKQGQVIRDTNTDLMQRVRNFVSSIPESVLGGVVLGGALGAPSIGGYRADYKERQDFRDKYGEDAYRMFYGLDPIDTDYLNSINVPLNESEIRYYNR